MGKKASGKTYTSKGERRSSMSTRNVDVTPLEKMNRKVDALAKGKRIVVTIANPNKSETNRPFVRVMYDMKTPKGQIISGTKGNS